MKRHAFLIAAAIVLFLSVSGGVQRIERHHVLALHEKPIAPLVAGSGMAESLHLAGAGAETAAAETGEEALKQTSWWGEVQENIRKSEYNITDQEKCVIEGAPGGLHATNRANNLRAYFRDDGVQIIERETSDPDWDVRWRFKSWGRPDSMRSVPHVAPAAEDHTNRVTYTYPGIEEWYVNSEEGLEHGFTITERPPGEGDLVLQGLFGGDVVARLSSSREAVEFTRKDDREVLQYTKLVIADARGKLLPAEMHLTRNPEPETREPSTALRIAITDDGAAYPLTVDPLYVPPPLGVSSGLLRLDVTMESNQAGADFGVSVSGAGDVNGDGYADVIVGAHDYDNGQDNEGAAFMFLGSASGLQGNAPGDTGVWMAESNQVEAYFGWFVSGAGDVNGDGYADVIVGSYYYDNGEDNEGAAFVFLGSASGLQGNAPRDTGVWMAESNQGGAYLGGSVSGAGDVNGDGYADVIVGAPRYSNGQDNEGAAFVFLGSEYGLQGNAPGDTGVWMAESNQGGAQGGAEFGWCVSGAGDVNGDGYADVIVGASWYNNGEPIEGAAFVFLGSASGLQGNAPRDTGVWMAESNQADASFGRSVSGAGDVNGDGYADIIVGAQYYDNGESYEGAAFVFLGSASGLQGNAPGDTGVWMAESNEAGALFGWAVSGAGDVNGDGYADVIVGADEYDNGDNTEGAAFVFLGSASGLQGNAPGDTDVWMAESNQAGALFGWAVSGAGDVNGDGYADVIVSAYWYDNSDNTEGAAFVFLGSASGLQGNAPGDTNVWMAESNQGGAYFGWPVSGAGDVNGDGYADVIVGAQYYDNGEEEEGAAFVFLGSASGLQGNAPGDTGVWMAESNRPYRARVT